MRGLKTMTIALLAVLGASAMNAPANAADRARTDGFMFDGLLLADSAADRARQEAQRREEQRRDDQRREQEQRRQEEQRQRAEERRREMAAAEQQRREEAAEQKRKDEADKRREEAAEKRKEEAAEKRKEEAAEKRKEQAAEKRREEHATTEQRRKEEQAAERRRDAEHRAAEQKKAVSHKAADAEPIHNGSIADRNNKGLTPQGGLSVAPATTTVNREPTSGKGGYADRHYAGPNGQAQTDGARATPVNASRVLTTTGGNAAKPMTPTAGAASNSPNWGIATGGPTPLTTNRTATTGATVATGAAATVAATATSAPKTKEEKLAAAQAEKKNADVAQQQLEQDYLKKVAAGVKLRATTCPDGEGSYYATGTMPKIKPEVVGCVDVKFQAICPGSQAVVDGVADNFIGMSGCFGDTYKITPKPACSVKDVQIRVTSAQHGCGRKG